MEFETAWELLLTGCLRGGFLALMAVGLSLVFGVMNIPQFAHGEFYMLGAYVAYFAFRVAGADPLVAIATAGLAGLGAGAVVERVIFAPLRRRVPGQWVMNAFLVTVGISFAMQNAAQAIWGGNYFGITRYWEASVSLGTSLAISFDRVGAFAIAVALVAALWIFLHRTDWGRAIRAVAQDETGAQLVGISLSRVHTLTFALGTMLAAVAGASLLSLVPAHPAMGVEPLYKSWYVVILGGLGSVGAAIPAGFLVGLIETLSYYWLGTGWQNVVSLSLLILILILKPAGLFARPVRGVWEK